MSDNQRHKSPCLIQGFYINLHYMSINMKKLLAIILLTSTQIASAAVVISSRPVIVSKPPPIISKPVVTQTKPKAQIPTTVIVPIILPTTNKDCKDSTKHDCSKK